MIIWYAVAFFSIIIIWLIYGHFKSLYKYSYIREFSESEELAAFIDSIPTIEWLQQWVMENIQYQSDIDLWGFQDYWATPQETWEMRAGDCESFHIFLSYCIGKRFNLNSDLYIIRKSFIRIPWVLHGVSVIYDVDNLIAINYDQLFEVEDIKLALPLIQDSSGDDRYISVYSQHTVYKREENFE